MFPNFKRSAQSMTDVPRSRFSQFAGNVKTWLTSMG